MVESKQIRLEYSCTEILPPVVSVLWLDNAVNTSILLRKGKYHCTPTSSLTARQVDLLFSLM